MAFTELGNNRPEFNDIADMIKQYFKDEFGSDIDVDDPTVAGQLAGILTQVSDNIAQSIEGGYNSLFVLRAKNSQLDDLGTEWGIYRKPATFSFANETVDAYIDQDNPVTIPEGSGFSTSDGHIFHTLDDLTFNEPTPVVNQNTGYISFLADQDGHELGRLTVQVVSDQPGDDSNVQPNAIVNSDDIDGLFDCFNASASIGGGNAETDESLRQRIMDARTSSPKFSDNGIIDDIKNLNNVRDVRLIDNREMEPDKWGNPPKSIHLYTIGGDDNDIANELFNHLYPTTKTNGSINVPVTANDGSKYNISFDHAQSVAINVQLSLTINSNKFDEDSAVPAIKQNVIDYFSTLNMGDEVLFSRLFHCAYTQPGVKRVDVSIGTNPSALSMQNIRINPFQLAITNSDLIDIEESY